MSETDINPHWIETLSPSDKNEIIFIRHGDSKYTETGTDLTEKGVGQIQETARALRGYLAGFDSVVVITSPAARAKGSAQIFEEEAGMQVDVRKDSKFIRPFDMKSLEQFLEYDKKNSTPIYGEMWLTDPLLSEENPLTESRKAVARRAGEFLHHYSRAIDSTAKKEGKKTAVLVFSHMEVGINYLQGVFPDKSNFPIKEEPALQNGEPVVIRLDDVSNSEYTIIARGARSKVKFDRKLGLFESNE